MREKKNEEGWVYSSPPFFMGYPKMYSRIAYRHAYI